MDDEKQYGFTLTICYKGSAWCEDKLRMWLDKYIFLRENFKENILYAQRIEGCGIIIIFDSSVNIFDVMQNINCNNIKVPPPNCPYIFQIEGIEIKQKDTKLSVLQILPSQTSPFLCLKTLKDYLEKFGLILFISRERNAGVCTGVIRALIILKDESTIPKSNNRHGDFETVQYLPNMFPFWNKETTKKLYDEFCSYVAKKQIEVEERMVLKLF